MQPKIIRKMQKIAVEHKNALMGAAAAAGAIASQVMTAAASSPTEVATNGSAILTAGIAIAQTQPLGYIIETFAVGIGALFFVRVVRKLA